ncbi:hypothetical protein LMG23994_05576 [Cupriavidus pinatubonensis]|uniref:2-oxoadipate dioxygenase/decarboxylase n=1 Tax=Cupriavidus pinatubonensis TaxID=248026 RepID=A0ABM8XX60_9BURK|nr:hypothetical protein LMG23994_05576 [Cupriavidus pinatubonensis]
MSDLYRAEVPQYGTLLELVGDVNAQVLAENGKPTLSKGDRINVERHGAIRLGTSRELSTIRRLFAVMGMRPVGYYDLSIAGVPVHSTAFRPVDDESLAANPFRVFTSLLRLELIEDVSLRKSATDILAKRSIFTQRCIELIEKAETAGGLTEDDAKDFVHEAIETFRWHEKATVSMDAYRKLRNEHPLIADVVSFQGPHINHLTPRTLDIEAVQREMPLRGIQPKAVIEGPPKRKAPILLRQTSFLALSEPITFADGVEAGATGNHTARFGEIEQRGIALTPLGRALYDSILAAVREEIEPLGDGSNAQAYYAALEKHFAVFPDDHFELHRLGLAFYRYAAVEGAELAAASELSDLHQLVADGKLRISPITYEDFLPVSAAGIFQSNLGNEARGAFGSNANLEAFQVALGTTVLDEMALYTEASQHSAREAVAKLASPHSVSAS